MVSNAELLKFVDLDDNATEIISRRPRQHRVEICEPNPNWPASFALIEQRIRAALGDRALSIQHIGSTSVPGLPAKDNIDVDLVVADPTDEENYVEALEGAGFQLLSREPLWFQRRFFGLHEPYASIHVFGPSCPEVVRHRLFKTWLCEHEDDRRLYADVKREAAEATDKAGEDLNAYNRRKQFVIRDIMARVFTANGIVEP